MTDLEGALHEIREALTLLPDCEPDGWWCPQCQDIIDCATYNECCTFCGTYLGDCQPDNETGKIKKQALKKLDVILESVPDGLGTEDAMSENGNDMHQCGTIEGRRELSSVGIQKMVRAREIKNEAAALLHIITKEKEDD